MKHKVANILNPQLLSTKCNTLPNIETTAREFSSFTSQHIFFWSVPLHIFIKRKRQNIFAILGKAHSVKHFKLCYLYSAKKKCAMMEDLDVNKKNKPVSYELPPLKHPCKSYILCCSLNPWLT